MKIPMHALILAPFSQDCVQALGRVMRVTHESWTDTRKLYDSYELADRINGDGISALVVESDFVFEETLELTPDLRFVGVCRNSVNQVDVDIATERCVVVVNTPARNANAVAEHALGLILALVRSIPAAHWYVHEGRWQEPTAAYREFQGVELCGRTLGVVGLGAIGKRLAGMCAALGMSVQAYDPYISGSPLNVELVPLDRLMQSSDVVSVHVPLTAETAGMLDESTLRLMRPNAYLVSASDAGVFDMNALADLLRNRLIAGAALDVFESHPISPQNPLLALDNVILSPHIGGSTVETVQRHSQMMSADILWFVQGKMPRNIVNPDAWRCRE